KLLKSVADNTLVAEGCAELRAIAEIVDASGYGATGSNPDVRIIIDPSVVRGLEYYTGPVFECELTFEVKGEDGKPVRFGSVGGGGRYDGLVSRFRPEPVPATGFSIGVSRLAAALKAINSPIVANADAMGPVVVLVMDKSEIGAYQKMVTELRNANIRAEMYLGESGMKAQMKYADRRNSPCVIIQGSDERAKGEVTIKDLIEGGRQASAAKTNEEYRSMRAAQFSCPESELVERVKDILAAHKA
ncbi:MAG: ATP phosphoribosyltransferase regulatory subunit, partial [Beijerinckiaceae bacterium]